MRLSVESEIMKHSVPDSSGHAGLCKMHSPLIFFNTTNKLMLSFTVSHFGVCYSSEFGCQALLLCHYTMQ